MASRDHLVGRPLVPFFDADESVNEALRVDHSTESTEQLDVDARVWDRELGYFVYPTAEQSKHHSQPIAIKRATDSQATANDSSSYGRALLTPDMLFSRSAPTASANTGVLHMLQPPTLNHTAAAPIANDNSVQPSTPRSASAKRASRQKSRSGTPTRSRNNNKQRGSPPQAAATAATTATTTDTGGSSGSDSNDKTTKNGATTNGSAKKNRNKNKKQDKVADDLSTNGKWAWSAFQSSPDPKSLPLPPFAINSPGLGALPPPKDPPKIEERWDPPVRVDRPPSLPPDAAPGPPPPSTAEHSMTQDLRRMLNIGS